MFALHSTELDSVQCRHRAGLFSLCLNWGLLWLGFTARKDPEHLHRPRVSERRNGSTPYYLVTKSLGASAPYRNLAHQTRNIPLTPRPRSVSTAFTSTRFK